LLFTFCFLLFAFCFLLFAFCFCFRFLLFAFLLLRFAFSFAFRYSRFAIRVFGFRPLIRRTFAAVPVSRASSRFASLCPRLFSVRSSVFTVDIGRVGILYTLFQVPKQLSPYFSAR